MFIEMLKWGFLIIFFATALLGILSLPRWINIDEWYRKKIFVALILEVVGAIIILFSQELITVVSELKPEITISKNKWIALNDSALIVRPEVNIKVQDNSIIKSFGEQSYLDFKGLKCKVVDNGLSIQNYVNASLGTIKFSDLMHSSIFNSFETSKNEISGTENYSYIEWIKRRNGKWSKEGPFIGPFELKVIDYSEGTYYQIENKLSGAIRFDSRKSSSKDLFKKDNRIIHFFEYKNVYYFLRIAWADLKGGKKYVHIINFRMEPTFKKD